jgi:hypothetical protein
MKLIITEHRDGHCEVEVRNAIGINEHVYSYDTKKEAIAFCSGFQCAKCVINGLVQSLPLSYELKRVPAEPETIGQQLSRQFVGSI